MRINNYAVFYEGRFKTVHLLNEGYLNKKIWV
ncbi:YoaP domain-containing protein [Anaerobacterium chartisolvens]|nr:YoaP domain-containing protein [Anaerobacterium chartisolvens]